MQMAAMLLYQPGALLDHHCPFEFKTDALASFFFFFFKVPQMASQGKQYSCFILSKSKGAYYWDLRVYNERVYIL